MITVYMFKLCKLRADPHAGVGKTDRYPDETTREIYVYIHIKMGRKIAKPDLLRPLKMCGWGLPCEREKLIK